jgi:hypothetical protein
MATQPIGPIKTLRMHKGLATDPIVENAKLKAMAGAKPVKRRIGGKVLTMGTAAEPVAGEQLMKPVPSRTSTPGPRPGHDQVPRPAAVAEAEPGSVRLRLRITNGRVSVIGVHAVPGVMPQPQRLDFGLAYEIKNGNRRVAVGTVPDVGMRRSYPDPEGRAGMQGHHLQALESIEVNLRLPQREFSAAALPRLNVQLFRMKSQPPAAHIAAMPLAQQYADQLRPVAELRGIDIQALSPSLRSAVLEAVVAAPVKLGAPS